MSRSTRSLPVAGVILWILTLWPTEPKMPPKRSTTHSYTCETTDLTLHVCKWPANESWWKLFQEHWWNGPIRSGIGTPRVEQNQTSHNERGNRSLLVRHLVWLRNPRGFQVRDRDGGSPGSDTYISKGKTDGWSILAKGRGSRSCVLVAVIICCVWKTNCFHTRILHWRIRKLFDFHMFVSHGSHFFIIYLEIARWDGGMTGRESPDWGNSWFRGWSLWRLSRDDNRRDSLGEGGWSCTVHISCTLQSCLLTRMS